MKNTDTHKVVLPTGGTSARAARTMKTRSISFLSGLIVASTVPVILNAASLSWNPSKIAKNDGIVALAEEGAKPTSKARMNVDSNGVILQGYDPVAYFIRHISRDFLIL